MRLERRMFTVPGFTPNCPGCITLDKDDGVRRGGHSAACRRRIEEHLGQCPEGREKLDRASFRKTEYLEQALKKARVSTEEPTVIQEATESGIGAGGSEQRGGASSSGERQGADDVSNGAAAAAAAGDATAADVGAGVGPIDEPVRGGESGFMEDPTEEPPPDPDER